MQLADLIEKRRFVGRELLLWLWMESELFDGTLSTREHGSFGLWIEKKLVLSADAESTRITAALPGLGREAKEALLRGQLPESAGIRISRGDDDTSLVLTGESFAVRGLKLQTELGGEGEAVTGDLVDEMAGRTRGTPKKKKGADEDEADDTPFYERMKMTREIEEVLAALYREFLALRLSARWAGVVVPTLQRWAEGERVDADAYRAARDGKSAKKRARA
ncbi:hypothetical protein [Sandaracinus amylolyticus]|uniref:Uncharacterized protein n=1 Tax=Sandaracinus amylolyticus TaxID=927083 RepID=A0A0F6YLQ5_9BACT|nr:hypothetical protein [Sandaracinus amylolyticus]AKF09747.1 hypothetical protein DB32_006896 [Sandaracinus amylolyticus]